MKKQIVTIAIIILILSRSGLSQITMQSYYSLAFSNSSYTDFADGTVIVSNGVDDLGYTNGGNSLVGPGYPIVLLSIIMVNTLHDSE